MASIELPPQLAVGQGHGKVPWMIRAIWEEHLGWFRFESTTELYNVPHTAVSPDLVELAGGPERVIGQAARHLAAGRPLHALHLAEIALTADPKGVSALRLKLAATESLLKQNNRENFSEVRWLEGEIRSLRGALAEVPA
jgi:alkyl sulfatase BDS1-like metallo-beta-lactamase superfamily hydrolase